MGPGIKSRDDDEILFSAIQNRCMSPRIYPRGSRAAWSTVAAPGSRHKAGMTDGGF